MWVKWNLVYFAVQSNRFLFYFRHSIWNSQVKSPRSRSIRFPNNISLAASAVNRANCTANCQWVMWRKEKVIPIQNVAATNTNTRTKCIYASNAIWMAAKLSWKSPHKTRTKHLCLDWPNMRGADRSSNVQIAVKYIERVSIGMGINRPRTLPCGKFTITHIQIFRKCDCVRQKERERGGGR